MVVFIETLTSCAPPSPDSCRATMPSGSSRNLVSRALSRPAPPSVLIWLRRLGGCAFAFVYILSAGGCSTRKEATTRQTEAERGRSAEPSPDLLPQGKRQPTTATGSPCADRAPWVRTTSGHYHVSFEYPPSCFPREEQDVTNGISLLGDDKEFVRLNLLENEVDPEDHLGKPKEDWVSAIKRKDWNYGVGEGESVAAVVSATNHTHMIFDCVVKLPIPEWKEFLRSPRHNVCAKIRASISRTP